MIGKKLEELYLKDRTRFVLDFKARRAPMDVSTPGFTHVTFEIDHSKCRLFNLVVPTERARKLLLLGWS